MSPPQSAPARFKLEVEPLNLGAGVKAIGLELTQLANGEPVRGHEAAAVWARVLTAVAATDPWAFDFFAHVDRVREYCRLHNLTFREAAPRCILVSPPDLDALEKLLERFETETFGVRAGTPLAASEPDASLEAELSRRGVDAYHTAFPRYSFCAVCDFENGFLTLLTEKLWASEVIRRVRPVLTGLGVSTALPS